MFVQPLRHITPGVGKVPMCLDITSEVQGWTRDKVRKDDSRLIRRPGHPYPPDSELPGLKLHVCPRYYSSGSVFLVCSRRSVSDLPTGLSSRLGDVEDLHPLPTAPKSLVLTEGVNIS